MRIAHLLLYAVFAPQLIEVASVKPSAHPGEPNLDSVRGRITATNMTAGYLIRFAYGLKDYQLEHPPGWIDTEQYDIALKSASLDEKAVLRELLADRLGLTSHRETKQSRIYLLTVAKSGAKLTPHNEGSGAKTRRSCGHLAGTRVTPDTLAAMLARELETEVLNRTELSGKYDFQLDWTPDAGPCRAAEGEPSNLPSFESALEKQAGLKLEPSKGPVEVLVIDRISKPAAN